MDGGPTLQFHMPSLGITLCSSDLKNTMLSPKRACDEYLCAVRDDSGIPLAAWNRARKKLFPKEADDDDVFNYVTQDATLIERASIIQESYRGQDNKALEETRSRWTDPFCAGNQVLFTELHYILGGLDI